MNIFFALEVGDKVAAIQVMLLGEDSQVEVVAQLPVATERK